MSICTAVGLCRLVVTNYFLSSLESKGKTAKHSAVCIHYIHLASLTPRVNGMGAPVCSVGLVNSCIVSPRNLYVWAPLPLLLPHCQDHPPPLHFQHLVSIGMYGVFFPLFLFLVITPNARC